MKTKTTLPALLAIALFVAAPVMSSAQDFPRRDEIVKIENGDDDSFLSIPEILEVFSQPAGEGKQYFLSVGHLGYGDEVLQVLFDPIYELFIPLGGSLQEALETLQSLQNQFNATPGEALETTGCLAWGVPDDKWEPVSVTLRKPLLSRYLEFSVQREGYIRSARIPRSEFNSIVRGVKFYQKIHPNE